MSKPLDDAWIALSLVPRIGNKTIDALLETFGTSADVLRASKKDLKAIRGIGEKTATAIREIDLETFQHDLERWQSAGIHIVTRDDAQYPTILREIPDPPLTLFASGQYHPAQWQPAVAIIGTRYPTAMSTAKARELAIAYSDSGWTVISGLALGIDRSAHEGALSAQNTPTIAVLGGGVLNIYPPENRDLADKILEAGALLSENAPDTTSTAPRLVTRNRIISGLCQRIIVVQSEANGGAMHAAKAALAQGRDLYTLNWQFSGNQALLQEGAHPIKPNDLVIPSAP